jgi:uncharacterized protein
MHIDRIVENKLKDLLQNDNVTLLLGARQVGKTTLVRPLVKAEDGVLLNCDIEYDKNRLLAISSLAPTEAMKALGSPKLLVIDEAQKVPDIGRIAKGWYDSHLSTKIVLLGSSSLDLLDRTAEPLTGRNDKVFLTPLLFSELLRSQAWYAEQFTNEHLKNHMANQIQAIMLEHIVFGGYPKVYSVADKEEYLQNITSDYLLRDVLQTGLVKNPEPINRLLTLLAHQAGSKVNVAKLAKAAGIARPTVENYLDILERCYVIFRVGAYSTNLRNEIGKDTKIFFWDTGVRNALLKEFSVSPLRSDIGLLYENWAMAEVVKQNLITGNKHTMYFWRKKDGAEVDLVIKGTNTFKAYEFKWSKDSATKGSKSFENAYNIPVEIMTKDNIVDLLLPEQP